MDLIDQLALCTDEIATAASLVEQLAATGSPEFAVQLELLRRLRQKHSGLRDSIVLHQAGHPKASEVRSR